MKVTNHIVWLLKRASLLTLLLAFSHPLLAQANITKAEYYIDTDPGINTATDIPITPGPTLDLNFTIPTGTLSRGFHTLVIRIQDENGVWSIQESRSFFVDLTTSISIEDLTDLEYFIDADPGVGNATPISITQGQTIDINEIIPTAALNPGFHVITVRVRDENGQWGIGESRAFYITQSTTTTQANITTIEYFFDTDPGVGNGTPLSFTAAANLNITDSIPTSSLSPGFHVLYLRAQDENGVWGIYESRSFYIDALGGVRISGIEYYIDRDPGVGSGNITDISPPVDSLTTTLLVPTDTMSVGTKTLGIRLRNDNNTWGLTEEITFSLCDGANASFVADTVCVGDVTTFTDLTPNELAGDVYFWDYDGDNVADTTITVSALVSNSKDGAFTFPTAGLYESRLIIDRSGCIDTARVQVLVNNFPSASFSAATVCEGDTTVFSDASTLVDSNATYRWDFNADATIDSTSVGGATHIYPAAGSYNAELEILNGQCSSGIVNIVVDVAVPPVADAGINQVVCEDSTRLAAIPPQAGEPAGWSILSGNGTFSDITSPTADVTNLDPAVNEFIWSVTELNGACTRSDTLSVNQIVTTLADAGPDLSLCLDSTRVTASIPVGGERGIWNLISGNANISNVTSPIADFTNMAVGINTFTWSIEDPGGFCLEVDTLVIAVNNPITAANNQQSVSVGVTIVIDLLTGAVINAGDVITASIITEAQQGTTSIQGTDLTYVSSTSGSGLDVIEFEICNQCGSCSRAQLAITIENLPPETSFNQNIQVTNANFSFDLLAGISDPNNNLDPQSLTVVQQPASGASAQIQNGVLVLNYSGIRFNGTDNVILQVCDLSGACTQFTLSFEVNTEDPQIVVYNAVTPNGDGRHDFLEIDNISFYENNVVRVFNRWGEEVDRIEGYDNSTNVFTGDRLPAGTYYYLISLTGSKEDASGSLLLKKAK